MRNSRPDIEYNLKSQWLFVQYFVGDMQYFKKIYPEAVILGNIVIYGLFKIFWKIFVWSPFPLPVMSFT